MYLTQSIQRIGRASQPNSIPDPLKIEFGRKCTPNFFNVSYSDGQWGQPVVEPLHNFSMHPAAMVFHYGQAIFEGLKAYRRPDGRVQLFRVDANARRFNKSARRMNMPEIPESLFLDAILNLVDLDRAFVPPRPGSLYLRPAMVASEACLGVRGSKEFKFFVIALPAGAYFPNSPSGAGSIRVQVAELASRASKGGTGNVKAAANYAVTLKTIEEAKASHCDQVLFLDGRGDRLIEEMGGMNIFFVREGRLLTPPLTDTILAGVTRDSIIHLANELQMEVAEIPLQIDEVVSEIESGTITEAFACGTAAAVAGIGSFRMENGRTVELKSGAPGSVTSRLYTLLTGIQFGDAPDPFGWTQVVNPVQD